MKFFIPMLLVSSVFTGCMTQADKDVWAEAKAHMSNSKNEEVAKAPEETKKTDSEKPTKQAKADDGKATSGR